MYPDWPKSTADLVPLPRCEGPKLQPFDFQGSPQRIEFLEYRGEGLHAHVLKVRILGKIYALKLFRFNYDCEWFFSPDIQATKYCRRDDEEPGGPPDVLLRDMPKDLEMLSTFSDYSEPFNAECRAFGRLQETGNEDLSVCCHGYLLLDEENERTLKNSFDLEFNGSFDLPGYHDLRSRFITMSASGKPPPIRGIVKDFGQVFPDLNPRNARRILRDVIRMQQLGIISIDVRYDQIVDGKLADFSKAITSPHYIMTPELNPRLTPKWVSAIEFETFQYSIGDYWDFDQMIFQYNLDYPEKKFTMVSALPRTPKYKLRETPSRARLYSLVDPRLFDWRKVTSDKQKIPAKGGGSRKGVSKKKPLLRLRNAPPKWWYDSCHPQSAAKWRRKRRGWCISLEWVYKDGLIFPVPCEEDIGTWPHITGE